MKEYSTSNDNYKIQQPETQSQFLAMNEDIVPKISPSRVTTYAPIRNIHTYPIMEHGDRY